jgi:ABC-type nickel/cobalt efflux system permease component RcnA
VTSLPSSHRYAEDYRRVFGLDEWIAQFGLDGTMGLAVALLLGLRHATDPDHLTAVSTLVLSNRTGALRRAGVLGLSWGLGHAATLFAFGLPIVLFRRYLPSPVQQAAEVAIGVVIAGLALRLLVRWRRGHFHTHVHAHDQSVHAHLHMHEHRPAHHPPAAHAQAHVHAHADALGRTPLAAFGIGLVHGIGGSAGVGVLLVGAIPERVEAVVALLVFAAATAVSMALVSSGFGYLLTRDAVSRRFAPLVPVFASVSLAFGAWYFWNALQGVPAP